jgi:hypothetical protein
MRGIGTPHYETTVATSISAKFFVGETVAPIGLMQTFG